MRKIAASHFKLIVNGKWLIVIFILLLFTIHYSLFTKVVHAQDCETATTSQDAINKFNECAIEKDIFDDKIFNLNQIAGTVDSLYTLLLGESQLHPETNNATRGGALAASGNLVVALYSTPPISGISYLASEFGRFNLVQPAYAQEGIGFSALSPVKTIWTAFRNISYVGFVIVFVIMGFMIMFRAHISPQAVATVQDSIPRIVVALILVTFSYAIAGLMIDIMFLFLNIVITALQNVSPQILTERANIVFEKSVFGVVWGSWKDTVATVAGAIKKIVDITIDAPLGLDKLLSLFGGGIAGLIVGIAMLFIMFRVFLMLLMAYAMIILLTMAAPFFFLIQALPGNNGAKEWFKQMAANVAVFPATALMFIFAGILAGIGDLGGVGSGVIEPSKAEVLKFPLLAGGFDPNIIGKLIGIGFLLMTPDAANMVKRFVSGPGGGGGFAPGAAVGAALGGAAGVAYTGTGARAMVGGVGGAFRMAAQEKQEKMAARIPFIGGALQARRKSLGIDK